VSRAVPSRGALWFALWGGGAAWLAHLLLVYLIGELGCMGRLQEVRWLGLSAVAWSVFAAAAVTLVVAAAALRVSLRALASVRPEGPFGATVAFVGRAGIAGNLLFLLVIAAQTVPVFFHLRDCGRYMLP
jgi:hypothetical protein